MWFRNTKLYSILFLKCPQCHQGAFLENSPYQLRSFNKVKEHCPKCNLKYSIEPSFYYGSMYVSYAVGIACSVAIFLITQWIGITFSLLESFITIVFSLILLMPYIGAISKAIWANLFFNFNKKIATQIRQNS